MNLRLPFPRRRDAEPADMFDRLPSPALLVGSRGHLARINPAASRLVGPLEGLRARTVDGEPADLLRVPADRTGIELALDRADGSTVQVLANTASTRRGTLITLTDVTAQRAAERRLREAEHHDALTGMANRSLLEHRFGEVSDMPYAVLMLDLDGVKQVNNAYGYVSGDELLRGVAQRVSQVCGPEATVARLGGDEFAVLLPRADAAQAQAAAAAVYDCFRWSFALSTGPVRAGGSIGYAVGGPGRSPSDVLADAARFATV